MSTEARLVDTVAEALWRASYYEGEPSNPFNDLFDWAQDEYRRMAVAAIEALGLTREWQVRTDGTEGWPLTSLSEAQFRLERAHKDNEVFLTAGGQIPDTWLNPRITSRLVSPWQAGSPTQPQEGGPDE